MAPEDRRRYTLGQMLAAIILVGVVAAYLTNPEASSSIRILLGLAAVVLLTTLWGSAAPLNQILARRCPSCGGWTMGRVAIHSFGDRFYRCGKCGIRARRVAYAWEDASAPEFDKYYARKRPENPWTAPPGMEDEDLVYSKTHVNLLLSKKRRNPNPPDQWAGRADDTPEE
jgi:hypothetical protein